MALLIAIIGPIAYLKQNNCLKKYEYVRKRVADQFILSAYSLRNLEP